MVQLGTNNANMEGEFYNEKIMYVLRGLRSYELY